MLLISAYILSIVLTLAQSGISKEKMLAAINCGGQSYVDENGIIYEKVVYSIK